MRAEAAACIQAPEVDDSSGRNPAQHNTHALSSTFDMLAVGLETKDGSTGASVWAQQAVVSTSVPLTHDRQQHITITLSLCCV
jgi:hypothetical protein